MSLPSNQYSYSVQIEVPVFLPTFGKCCMVLQYQPYLLYLAQTPDRAQPGKHSKTNVFASPYQWGINPLSTYAMGFTPPTAHIIIAAHPVTSPADPQPKLDALPRIFWSIPVLPSRLDFPGVPIGGGRPPPPWLRASFSMAVPGADSLVETWRFPFISHSKAWGLVYLDLRECQSISLLMKHPAPPVT
ncbi:Uncharacterized protein HZ326_1093 [Fusarium oxysporum f. sp. albedinis]|nr:Uncharacterized protein HZ326_1093 [Fusarium oxysporum f. sp. albedinis]